MRQVCMGLRRDFVRMRPRLQLFSTAIARTETFSDEDHDGVTVVNFYERPNGHSTSQITFNYAGLEIDDWLVS